MILTPEEGESQTLNLKESFKIVPEDKISTALTFSSTGDYTLQLEVRDALGLQESNATVCLATVLDGSPELRIDPEYKKELVFLEEKSSHPD